MTDTGAYTDVMCGLLWLLGFQFSPRLRDIGGTRFWRIDREADYGPLNDLAKHCIRPQRIVEHCDDMLRIAGSLMRGSCHSESLIRTLQRGELRQRYGEGQEDQRTALGLVMNAIIVWNTMDMQRALDQLGSTGQPVLAADVARRASLGYAHLNLLGRDTFALPELIAQGEWHPLNTTSQGQGRLHGLAYSYFPFRFYRELRIWSGTIARCDAAWV